jgi:hypothetical protein
MQWLKAVADKKETVWQQGTTMLHGMETQIELYETHLLFVEDVINDIKQLDYDVVREIGEIKAAFNFNQVLLSFTYYAYISIHPS